MKSKPAILLPILLVFLLVQACGPDAEAEPTAAKSTTNDIAIFFSMSFSSLPSDRPSSHAWPAPCLDAGPACCPTASPVAVL